MKAAAGRLTKTDANDDLLVFQGARVVAVRERQWSGVSALLYDLRSEGAFEARLSGALPSLLLTVEASGGRIVVTADRSSPSCHRPGPISILPPETSGWLWGNARSSRLLLLRFDLAALPVRHDECDLAASFRPRFMVDDPRVAQLCLMLVDECLSLDPMGCLFGDGLVQSLLQALAAETVKVERAVGGLAPWQMAHLETFVAERLGDPLSLECLAHVVGVSRSHLGRIFKQTTGQSPFEWLRAKRIDRAKELLAAGEPLAQIASLTGFADQSHLTRAFSRRFGITPGRWQRMRGLVVPGEE